MFNAAGWLLDPQVWSHIQHSIRTGTHSAGTTCGSGHVPWHPLVASYTVPFRVVALRTVAVIGTKFVLLLLAFSVSP